MAVVLFGLMLFGAESYWRSLGYRPHVDDEQSLWIYHRGRIYGDKTVVLLGTSRMQYGFSTRQFRKQFPDHRVVQLAIKGDKAVAALNDLSRDQRFKGLVIFDSLPHAMVPVGSGTQQEWVDAYHQHRSMNVLQKYRKLTAHADQLLYCAVRNLLAVTNPRVSVKKAMRLLPLGRTLPKPFHLAMNSDRSIEADFQLEDPAQLWGTSEQFTVQRNQAALENLEQWLEGVAQLEPMIERIQARGGTVVYVRFPTSGARLEADQIRHPKAQFWDRFAKQTSARTVHFLDVPEMAHMTCPDMAHIDKRDAPHFTKVLLEELVRCGLLPLDRR